MLWLFTTVALTGILCGCLFRAPALVFMSFVSFGGAFVLAVIADWSIMRAVVTAILLTATLQGGYLFGAGFCYLRQNFRSRLDGVDMGPDFQEPLRRA